MPTYEKKLKITKKVDATEVTGLFCKEVLKAFCVRFREDEIDFKDKTIIVDYKSKEEDDNTIYSFYVFIEDKIPH